MKEMVDINTTPLIDVMLVLLIMLIISVPVQTHALRLGLQSDAPAAAARAPAEPIVIDIDFDGALAWNGAPLADTELETRLRAAASRSPQPPLHLRANQLVAYGRVAMVMAAAQRLGIAAVGIYAEEPAAR